MMHLATLILLISIARPAAAQHADVLLFSTEPGGGALTASLAESDVIELFQSVCVGGQCLFSNPNPGFNQASQDRPQNSQYLVEDGTVVTLEVVAIDGNLSIKFGDTTLRVPGDDVRLGTSPNIHIHPSWQMLAPPGEIRDTSVTLRLRANRTYQSSEPIVMRFRNGPVIPSATPTVAPVATRSPTPVSTSMPSATTTTTATSSATRTPTPTVTAVATATATATTTSTATVTPVPCTGDCSGDGEVTVDEVVTGINIALGNVAMEACWPFDANADASVTVEEIVRAVNAGLGGCP